MEKQIGFIIIGLPMIIGFTSRVLYDLCVVIDSVARKDDDDKQYYKQRLIIELAVFSAFTLSFLGLYYLL